MLRLGLVRVTVERVGVDDVAVAAALVRLVNQAYAAGEAGLWKGSVDRTDAAEITAAISAGHMLVARDDDGRILGCLRTRSIDPTTSEVGLIGVDPTTWGSGIGRILLAAAEALAHARGATTMQLELLVPRTGTHPAKQRLHDWYTRRGYAVTQTTPMEDYLPDVAPLLSTPGDILIFAKPL
jgi:GNAT superfamily N-acetyltransferase